MGSKGSRLAESERGVQGSGWKSTVSAHGIFKRKYELILFRGRKTLPTPQILEPRLVTFASFGSLDPGKNCGEPIGVSPPPPVSLMYAPAEPHGSLTGARPGARHGWYRVKSPCVLRFWRFHVRNSSGSVGSMSAGLGC